MKVIIDRFEGEYAVCEKEDRSFVNIYRDKIPEGCKEGEVLLINDVDVVYRDNEGTRERKKKIKELMGELFE